MIIPKKEILYAPMLATFGGGSGRGWGRGKGRFRFEMFIRTTRAGRVGYQNTGEVAADTTMIDGSTPAYFLNGGMIMLEIPKTATYEMTITGGGSLRNKGGNGAYAQGQVNLAAGGFLRILIGQEGTDSGGSLTASAHAGAGGTFVVNGGIGLSSLTNSHIYLVAGGGGGAHEYTPIFSGSHGQTGTSGHASNNNAGAGGTGGYAGANPAGYGGAGFFGDGSNSTTAFVNGGYGGDHGGSHGGFGGGGPHGNSHGGGGGGYSGGGGSSSDPYQGGGGGSYIGSMMSSVVQYGGGSSPVTSSAGGSFRLKAV